MSFVATSPPARSARLRRRLEHREIRRSSTFELTKEHRGEEVSLRRRANPLAAEAVSTAAGNLFQKLIVNLETKLIQSNPATATTHCDIGALASNS